MRTCTIILLACLTSFISLANNQKVISGTILDRSSNEPLPFANILYGDQGTTTNIDGEFVLSITKSNADEKLLIKFIGYETQVLSIEELSLGVTISLKPSTKVLEEITVYSAKEIIRDITTHYQINYEFEDQMLSSYYKETLNSSKEYLYLAEGILDIYYPTIYSKEETLISPQKTRKKEFKNVDEESMPLINGHASDMVNSITRRENSFIHLSQMNNYEFSKQGLIEYDGKEVFEIKFEPKTKKATSRGVIYVDVESKAIVKTEYYPLIENQNFWTKVKWTEEFVEINGTWYLNHVTYTGEWKNPKGENMAFNAMLIITDHESIKQKPQLANTIKDNDIFFKEASNFSEGFWEGHNFVKLSLDERMLVGRATPSYR